MVASSLASLTWPAFDKDVGPDPGDRRHFQRQRLTEILWRLSADRAERVPPSKNPGRQEKEHPVHDPFAQGRGVYLRTAFDQERRDPSPPQFFQQVTPRDAPLSRRQHQNVGSVLLEIRLLARRTQGRGHDQRGGLTVSEHLRRQGNAERGIQHYP